MHFSLGWTKCGVRINRVLFISRIQNIPARKNCFRYRSFSQNEERQNEENHNLDSQNYGQIDAKSKYGPNNGINPLLPTPSLKSSRVCTCKIKHSCALMLSNFGMRLRSFFFDCRPSNEKCTLQFSMFRQH